MKLDVTTNKKGEDIVKCPRLNKNVDSFHICKSCEWLAVVTGEYVRCRWTQEKEDLKQGRRRYETT